MAQKTECTDHLGNHFSSIRNMCKAHDIPYNTYMYRIKSGYRIEDALSKEPVREKYSKSRTCVKDYKGKSFKNMTAMCKYYGISLTLFMKRRERGKTLEEALKPVKIYKDHLGNTYPSLKALGIKYKIRPSVIKHRLENGYSLEETLTKDKRYFKPKKVKDHLVIYAKNQNDLKQTYIHSEVI